MSCWGKCASLLFNFLFLLLVFNSLVHVGNRPDYHVNLMLTYRFFFDNLRPQSYLKASVFFLGEAILTKAWTEGPCVAKVYIFVENRITYEGAWIAQRKVIAHELKNNEFLGHPVLVFADVLVTKKSNKCFSR